MNRIMYLFVIALSVSAGAQTARWSELKRGLDLLEGSFDDHGQLVSFVLVRSNLRMNRVRIIDTYHEIGKANAHAAFSVREVRDKTRASVVVNAGPTKSYSIPAPSGLLQANGRVVSPANYRVQDGGVLCLTKGGVSIVPLSQNKPLRCFEAVQRGPFLSRNAMASKSSENLFFRTVAAVDVEGRLLVLVTTRTCTLSAVATFLYDPGSGLNVQSALNLDGDVSSGMIYSISGAPMDVGNVDGLIASAIAIY